MKKPKIAFVIGTLRSGGAERVITNLANALVADMDVCILTFKDTKPFYELHPDIKVIPFAKDYPKPKHLIASITLNLKILYFLIRTLRLEKIQLAIGFITMSNILTTIAANINNIPSVISERNNPYAESTPKFWEILRKLIYPKASVLIVQTKPIIEFYSKFVPEERIAVIPNSISESLCQKKNPEAIRKNIILNVGRLEWQKNQKLLIRAFSNMETKNWKLVIIGSGQLKGILESEIEKSGKSNSIEILPPSTNIHNFYNEAKIFAFPSRFEGFPNALLEALHFGIPSVSADCPFGPAELISHGKNGFLIPSEDQHAMEECLKLLMDNSNLWEAMSEQAEILSEPYSEAKILEKWTAIFKELLANQL